MGIPIALSDPENLSPMFNKKSYSHLSAGLLVVGSILGCAVQAQAQTVNVPFNGNVPGSCVFGAPVAGTLAKYPSAPGIIAASSGLAALGGGPGAGTIGSVTITCQTNSIVTIAVPVGSGPVGFSPATVQGLLQRNGSGELASAKTGPSMEPGGPWNGVSSSSMTLPSGISTLNVHMAAGTPISIVPGPIPAPIPTGNYNYTVNLSVTGN
jgi:hypothetical protein